MYFTYVQYEILSECVSNGMGIVFVIITPSIRYIIMEMGNFLGSGTLGNRWTLSYYVAAEKFDTRTKQKWFLKILCESEYFDDWPQARPQY